MAEGDDVTLPELVRRLSRLEQNIDRKLDVLMDAARLTTSQADLIRELRSDVDQLTTRSDRTDGILTAFRWALILLGALATIIGIATALGKWPTS